MTRRIPIHLAKKAAEREPEPEAMKEPALEAEAAESRTEEISEAETWQKRYLHLQADFENFRRHAEAERARLAGQGKEAALSDIFPLVDHLDRGLAWAHEHGADPAIIEGLLLVQKEFSKVLEKHGIERLATIGEVFNPELHEAASVIEREGAEEGEIVEELQAGFSREGKLLRPARVVVAG